MIKYSLDDLIFLMQCLRDPVGGCPWDLKQTYRTLVASTLEEAYEVVDTIEQGHLDALKEELGDLVFQAIFYSQLANEEGKFNFYNVIDGLVDKLIRRHPHVFPKGILESPQPGIDVTEAETKKQWESIKQNERTQKGQTATFDDLPLALPALTRAQKIQKRMPTNDSPSLIIGKMQAKLLECAQTLDQAQITHTIGELLFLTSQLAKNAQVDAETALRNFNQTLIAASTQLTSESAEQDV